MGAREHEGGVEAVQELHVVSSVLDHSPVWVFVEHPGRRTFFLRGRRDCSGDGGVGRSCTPGPFREALLAWAR